MSTRLSSIFHMAVFAFAYCSFLFYFWATDANRHSQALTMTGNSATPDIASNVVSVQQSTAISPISTEQMQTNVPHSSNGASSRKTPVNVVVDEADSLSANIDAMSSPRRDTSSADVEAALRVQSIGELSNVIAHDQVVSHRLVTVVKLRALASQGDTDGQARSALLAAMSDSDPRVANAARIAYEFVAQRNSRAR